MKIISYILAVVFLAFTSTGWSLNPVTDLNEDSWQEIVEYAQENLSLEGTLMHKPNVYICLKVDNGYIHDLYPLLGLEEKGFVKPKTSAHIGISRREEWQQYHVWPAQQNPGPWVEPGPWFEEEIGQTFHFTLQEITIIKTNVNPDNYEAVMMVQSPELNALRAKYGLHDSQFFYISLAKRHY